MVARSGKQALKKLFILAHEFHKKKKHMNTFQVVILCYGAWFNFLVASFSAIFSLAYFKYPELRKHVLQSIQDGDDITHQRDGKFVVALILGLFCALFTGNLTLAIIAFTDLQVGYLGLIAGFAGITFTLLGISYKGFGK